MKSDVTPLERAFQLARSVPAASVSDIRDALKREGYDIETVEGPSFSKQLPQLIKGRGAVPG